jgi:hypothetical protein
MRKLVLGMALAGLFGVGIFAGLMTTKAEAGLCYWKCGCNGVPLKCCGTSCKPDPNGPIQCPQGADC